MAETYAHFPVAMWIIDGVIWGLGGYFWVFTYIAAPIMSQKKGYNISGLPGMAFLFFLVASYLSLNRWLMLISLSDVSIITLVITICTDFIHKKKRNEQDRHE